MSNQSREMEELNTHIYNVANRLSDFNGNIDEVGTKWFEYSTQGFKKFIQANFIPISVIEGFIKENQKDETFISITLYGAIEIPEWKRLEIEGYNRALFDLSTLIKKQ